MKVIETVVEFREACLRATRPLGLVPTMGSLHGGHMALFDRARAENSTVAATIFVNPMQFHPDGDYSTYPVDTDSDLSSLREAGADLVFHPSVMEMYPPGFDTRIDVGRITWRLEGEVRPGHFTGVATVVCKLLSIARPDRAYFGQKDAQQSLVIKRLNQDLDLGVEIAVVPTTRDSDGLALSSRNIYLDTAARKAAPVLYRCLCLGREMWESGIRDAETIRKAMRGLIEAEPLARLDYISVAHGETLEEQDVVVPPTLISLAVRIGKARLIDNVRL